MTKASEWLKENLVLSCPSGPAALIFYVSASSDLLKKSQKLGCPGIEYWVRAIRGTRIGFAWIREARHFQKTMSPMVSIIDRYANVRR